LEVVERRGLARLVARQATSITIEVLGLTETYDIFKVFEFSSERRMMSVVVRNRLTRKVHVFSKGAPDSLNARLGPNSASGAADLKLANQFAAEGLRVLAFGTRLYAGDEKEGPREEVGAADVESDLSLVGVTAVEDLL